MPVMQKGLMKLATWLLCLVMFTGAVACSGGKSASGKKSPGIETPQQKQVVTDCLHREKPGSSLDCAPDNFVVENNALSDGWNNILPSGAMDYGQSVQSYVKYAQDNNLPPEQVQAGLAQMVKGDLPESADIIKAILSNNPGSDTVMALLTAEEAKDYALALLTSIPAEKALSLVGKATGVISNKILISAAEKISTAKPGKQFTAPRDLNEQVLWNQVKENPSGGHPLKGMNTDPRFPTSAGFQKMATNHTLPDGSNIEIHYQYNAVTNKAYDVKIVTPKRSDLQPGPSLKEMP